jgi:hypothetical protein
MYAQAPEVCAVARARANLPRRVILLRHGESEGNADETLYRTKPDNLIELTAEGTRQVQLTLISQRRY